MSVRRLLAASVGAGVVLLVACGGSPGSSCGSYYDELVSRASSCGASTSNLDPNAKSGLSAACDNLAKAPGASNFAGQVDQCTNQLKSLTCDQSTPSCLITGSLADGSACATSVQCTGGRCDTSGTTSTNTEVPCGKCASYVAVGGSCASGGTCNPTTGTCSNGTCTAFAQQGQSCTNGVACVSGLTCAQGTCAPLPTKGQACTSSCASPYRCISGTCADAVQAGGACTFSECATNLTCVSQKCVAPTYAAEGQPCGLVNGQAVSCQGGLRCSGLQGGTCVAPKNAGDACTVGKLECATSLSCIGGTCAVPDYSVCK